ncbi:hypothetical protein KIPB_002052, partial [Kipferlia bialata]
TTTFTPHPHASTQLSLSVGDLVLVLQETERQDVTWCKGYVLESASTSSTSSVSSVSGMTRGIFPYTHIVPVGREEEGREGEGEGERVESNPSHTSPLRNAVSPTVLEEEGEEGDEGEREEGESELSEGGRDSETEEERETQENLLDSVMVSVYRDVRTCIQILTEELAMERDRERERASGSMTIVSVTQGPLMALISSMQSVAQMLEADRDSEGRERDTDDSEREREREALVERAVSLIQRSERLSGYHIAPRLPSGVRANISNCSGIDLYWRHVYEEQREREMERERLSATSSRPSPASLSPLLSPEREREPTDTLAYLTVSLPALPMMFPLAMSSGDSLPRECRHPKMSFFVVAVERERGRERETLSITPVTETVSLTYDRERGREGESTACLAIDRWELSQSDTDTLDAELYLVSVLSATDIPVALSAKKRSIAPPGPLVNTSAKKGVEGEGISISHDVAVAFKPLASLIAEHRERDHPLHDRTSQRDSGHLGSTMDRSGSASRRDSARFSDSSARGSSVIPVLDLPTRLQLLTDSTPYLSWKGAISHCLEGGREREGERVEECTIGELTRSYLACYGVSFRERDREREREMGGDACLDASLELSSPTSLNVLSKETEVFCSDPKTLYTKRMPNEIALLKPAMGLPLNFPLSPSLPLCTLSRESLHVTLDTAKFLSKDMHSSLVTLSVVSGEGVEYECIQDTDGTLCKSVSLPVVAKDHSPGHWSGVHIRLDVLASLASNQTPSDYHSHRAALVALPSSDPHLVISIDAVHMKKRTVDRVACAAVPLFTRGTIASGVMDSVTLHDSFESGSGSVSLPLAGSVRPKDTVSLSFNPVSHTFPPQTHYLGQLLSLRDNMKVSQAYLSRALDSASKQPWSKVSPHFAEVVRGLLLAVSRGYSPHTADFEVLDSHRAAFRTLLSVLAKLDVAAGEVPGGIDPQGNATTLSKGAVTSLLRDYTIPCLVDDRVHPAVPLLQCMSMCLYTVGDGEGESSSAMAAAERERAEWGVDKLPQALPWLVSILSELWLGQKRALGLPESIDEEMDLIGGEYDDTQPEMVHIVRQFHNNLDCDLSLLLSIISNAPPKQARGRLSTTSRDSVRLNAVCDKAQQVFTNTRVGLSLASAALFDALSGTLPAEKLATLGTDLVSAVASVPETRRRRAGSIESVSQLEPPSDHVQGTPLPFDDRLKCLDDLTETPSFHTVGSILHSAVFSALGHLLSLCSLSASSVDTIAVGAEHAAEMVAEVEGERDGEGDCGGIDALYRCVKVVAHAMMAVNGGRGSKGNPNMSLAVALPVMPHLLAHIGSLTRECQERHLVPSSTESACLQLCVTCVITHINSVSAPQLLQLIAQFGSDAGFYAEDGIVPEGVDTLDGIVSDPSAVTSFLGLLGFLLASPVYPEKWLCAIHLLVIACLKAGQVSLLALKSIGYPKGSGDDSLDSGSVITSSTTLREVVSAIGASSRFLFSIVHYPSLHLETIGNSVFRRMTETMYSGDLRVDAAQGLTALWLYAGRVRPCFVPSLLAGILLGYKAVSCHEEASADGSVTRCLVRTVEIYDSVLRSSPQYDSVIRAFVTDISQRIAEAPGTLNCLDVDGKPIPDSQPVRRSSDERDRDNTSTDKGVLRPDSLGHAFVVELQAVMAVILLIRSDRLGINSPYALYTTRSLALVPLLSFLRRNRRTVLFQHYAQSLLSLHGEVESTAGEGAGKTPFAETPRSLGPGPTPSNPSPSDLEEASSDGTDTGRYLAQTGVVLLHMGVCASWTSGSADKNTRVAAPLTSILQLPLVRLPNSPRTAFWAGPYHSGWMLHVQPHSFNVGTGSITREQALTRSIEAFTEANLWERSISILDLLVERAMYVTHDMALASRLSHQKADLLALIGGQARVWPKYYLVLYSHRDHREGGRKREREVCDGDEDTHSPFPPILCNRAFVHETSLSVASFSALMTASWPGVPIINSRRRDRVRGDPYIQLFDVRPSCMADLFRDAVLPRSIERLALTSTFRGGSVFGHGFMRERQETATVRGFNVIKALVSEGKDQSDALALHSFKGTFRGLVAAVSRDMEDKNPRRALSVSLRDDTHNVLVPGVSSTPLPPMQQDFYLNDSIRAFTWTEPVSVKGQTLDAEAAAEAAEYRRQSYIFPAHSFPGLSPVAEVLDGVCVSVSPVSVAVSTLGRMNAHLRDKIDRVNACLSPVSSAVPSPREGVSSSEAGAGHGVTTQVLSDLARPLTSAILSPINGGSANYIRYFSRAYLSRHPPVLHTDQSMRPSVRRS